MDSTDAPELRFPIPEEMRHEIYGNLNTMGQCLVREGISPDSFVAYALQVDPHSRWRCVAEMLFESQELARAAQEGSSIFIYGNMEPDVFIEIFGEVDTEIEPQLREDLDEGDIRAVIITHDGIWFADIELTPVLN